MDFNPKQSKAREFLWLAIALMSLLTGVHKTIYHSFQSSWYFFIFVLVALLMYKIWRNKRLNNK